MTVLNVPDLRFDTSGNVFGVQRRDSGGVWVTGSTGRRVYTPQTWDRMPAITADRHHLFPWATGEIPLPAGENPVFDFRPMPHHADMVPA
jgi:hypothetical protein